MSPLKTRPLIAAVLAMAGLAAHAGEHQDAGLYGGPSASVFASSKIAVAAKATPPATKQKKGKAAKKIVANVDRLPSRARRALAQIERPGHHCHIAAEFCPAVYSMTPMQSQPWRYDLHPPISERTMAETPALVPSQADLPGLVPGRESIYKISLNLLIGRDETVQLQAKIRKNPDNPQTVADSTLRADWSLRF